MHSYKREKQQQQESRRLSLSQRYRYESYIYIKAAAPYDRAATAAATAATELHLSLSSPSVRTHSTEAAAEKKLQPQIYTKSMQMHTYKQCPRYQVAPPGNGGQNYLLKASSFSAEKKQQQQTGGAQDALPVRQGPRHAPTPSRRTSPRLATNPPATYGLWNGQLRPLSKNYPPAVIVVPHDSTNPTRSPSNPEQGRADLPR